MPTTKNTLITLTLIICSLSLIFTFQNCSQQLEETSDIYSSTMASTLALSPSSVTVSPAGTYQFSASGGTGSYTYSVSPSGYASITSTGYFTAGSVNTTVTVLVQDSAGAYTSSLVTISSSGTSTSTGTTLTLSPSSVTVAYGSGYQFYVSGGSGSYSFYLNTSGYGSITTGGYFTAGSTAGTIILTVVDNTYGTSATGSISISSSSASGTLLCSDAYACGKIVNANMEIDGRTPAMASTNANALCRLYRGNTTSIGTYILSTHSISCGKNYGLLQWNGSNFQHYEVEICYLGYVTVISQINCS